MSTPTKLHSIRGPEGASGFAHTSDPLYCRTSGRRVPRPVTEPWSHRSLRRDNGPGRGPLGRPAAGQQRGHRSDHCMPNCHRHRHRLHDTPEGDSVAPGATGQRRSSARPWRRKAPASSRAAPPGVERSRRENVSAGVADTQGQASEGDRTPGLLRLPQEFLGGTPGFPGAPYRREGLVCFTGQLAVIRHSTMRGTGGVAGPCATPCWVSQTVSLSTRGDTGLHGTLLAGRSS